MSHSGVRDPFAFLKRPWQQQGWTGFLRWTATGIALIVFGLVDLLLVLLLPLQYRTTSMITSVLAAAVVLVTLPYLLSLFQRQQDHIERQQREIDTLHAMDTAIVSEMELSRLLGVAVRNAIRAVDAEAGGIALFHPQSGKLLAEEYQAVGQGEEELDRLRAITRSGHHTADDDWLTLILPLGADPVQDAATTAELTFVYKRNGRENPADVELTGYLVTARRQPAVRPFTDSDRELLAALSATIDVAVANARALEAVKDSLQVKEELARERRVARVLTEALLPDVPSQAGEWRFARRYEAQGQEALVGGDIYDLFRLGGQRWGIVIADVSGKGLAAARKTAMVKYFLRSYAREHDSPAEVLRRLNSALFDEPDLTGFVTLFYGVLNEAQGTLTYASAGHEPPVLRRSGPEGAYETLLPTGLVLGAAPEQDYREDVVTLWPGDGLLLFTDGLSEARSCESGQLLEEPGIFDLLDQLRSPESDTPMTDRIWDAITEYTGGRMRDDVALLWIERIAVPAYLRDTTELAGASA